MCFCPNDLPFHCNRIHWQKNAFELEEDIIEVILSSASVIVASPPSKDLRFSPQLDIAINSTNKHSSMLNFNSSSVKFCEISGPLLIHFSNSSGWKILNSYPHCTTVSLLSVYYLVPENQGLCVPPIMTVMMRVKTIRSPTWGIVWSWLSEEAFCEVNYLRWYVWF